MTKRFVAAVGLALCASLAAAKADPTPAPLPVPTPIVLPTVPPDAKVDPWTRTAIQAIMSTINATSWRLANQSSGNVTYFKHYELQIQIGRDQYRQIHLHQGTVINPRGASIETGQRVEVGGIAQPDGSLNANVITIVGS